MLRYINVREYRRGNQKKENPEKLATWDTRDKEKQKHSTIYAGHHYTQTIRNNVNKICVLLQTTGNKDDSNIAIIQKS